MFMRNIVVEGIGGGAYIYSATNLQVMDSIFEENNALQAGGMATEQLEKLNISNSSFSFNTVGQDSNSGGGAAYFVETRLFIYNSLFSANMGLAGGAIVFYSTGRDAYISNSTFDSNSNYQSPTSTYGSPVLLLLNGKSNSGNNKTNNEPVVEIVDSLFSSNIGYLGGGVISAYNGVLNITRTVFNENQGDVCGAILLNSTSAFFHENTYLNNAGGVGSRLALETRKSGTLLRGLETREGRTLLRGLAETNKTPVKVTGRARFIGLRTRRVLLSLLHSRW